MRVSFASVVVISFAAASQSVLSDEEFSYLASGGMDESFYGILDVKFLSLIPPRFELRGIIHAWSRWPF
jgi:hypothetical protein